MRAKPLIQGGALVLVLFAMLAILAIGALTMTSAYSDLKLARAVAARSAGYYELEQQLLPSPTKGRVPVFEIMTATPGIRSMIREGKTHQIDNAIHSGAAQDRTLMEYSIAEAYKNGDRLLTFIL